MFTSKASRSAAFVLVTLASSAFAAHPAGAQRAGLQNVATLKIREWNSILETRAHWSGQRGGGLSSYEGIAIDSVLVAREDSVTYVQKHASERSSWRMVRDTSGRAQLVAIGRALPAADDAWKDSREGLSRFVLSRRDSVANVLRAARRFLENAAIFEDAPTLGTVRRADVRQKWHSLDLRLEVTGRRTSTRLRDSVAPDGRHYAIVREQATFDIVEVRPRGDSYSAGALNSRDSIHATSTGTRLVSLATARVVVMWDTATIIGRHVRRDIDGIELPSQTENRQIRELRWESEADEGRQSDSTLRNRQALSFGPPVDPLYERMQRHDVRLRDSLHKVLAKSLSFSKRNEALALLRVAPGVVITRRWEDSVALAAGDTAWVVQHLVRESGVGMTVADFITPELWRLSLPFMRQRRYAWDRGIDSWQLAGSLIETLSKTVPAFTSDRALWPCDSVTCESIAREYQSSRITPIAPAAQVGLAMRALLRPAPWADSVLAHESDAPLLGSLRAEIAGISFASTSAPDVSAPWREWMFWKYGIKSDSAFERVRRNGDFRILEGPRGLSAASVLRWRAARTGADYGSILRPRYAAAVNDTERVIYASILNDLDLLRDSLMQVSALLSSSKPASQTIGRMQLDRLWKSATAPDSISLSEIRAILVRKFAAARSSGPSTFQQFMELPSATRADSIALAGAGITLVPSTWQPPSDQSSIKTRVSIEQLGPFVWITYTQGNVAVRDNHATLVSGQAQLTVMHRAFDFWHVVDERYW